MRVAAWNTAATYASCVPDIAVPRGKFTGWNLYKAPMPEGELADRDGTYLAFEAERYPSPEAYSARVEAVVAELRRERAGVREPP